MEGRQVLALSAIRLDAILISIHRARRRFAFASHPEVRVAICNIIAGGSDCGAVQRPTMSFVVVKTPSKWTCWPCIVCARALWAGTINQIRGFLIERGIIVRQGVVPCAKRYLTS
jgi:hypothetical protein